MSDMYRARRRLTQIHNDLRNEGLNPIEALEELSCRLVELRSRDGELEFVEQTSDLISLVYQEILAPSARNGLGQYLTPLPVADMMAHVISGLTDPVDILDPFCGIGILLDRVGAIVPDAELLGIEINESVARMARSLSELGESPMSLDLRDTFSGLRDNSLPSVDVVATNPPFGATVTASALDELQIPRSLRSLGKLPAELLGLEVSIQCLRPGGVLAIVLPQSILTNRRWSAYRADALRRLEVCAVVSLPEETFGPFRGVANACVLFGTRADVGVIQEFPMYTSESVGYSSTGRQSTDSDLPEIARQIVMRQDSTKRVKIFENGKACIESECTVGADGVTLGELAEIFVGKNPARTHYAADGPWLLKVGDLAGSVVPWRPRAKNRVAPAWFYKQRRIHLRTGDICLTAAGHRPKYIGLKVDLIDEVPPEGAAPSGEVMVIRLRQDNQIEPEQLLFYLRSENGYGSIQELVRGSTGHLYAGDLAEMRVPQLHSRYTTEAVEAYRAAVRHYREYRRHETQADQAIRTVNGHC